MRLSLRRKIVGGFGLLLVLIILLGWVTLSLFDSVRSVQRKVFADAVPGLIAVDEIVRSYTAQSAAINAYLIAPRPQLLEQYSRELAAAEVAESEADKVFTSGEASSDERALLSDLEKAGREFHTLVEEKIIPLADDGRRALAFSVLTSEGVPLTAQIEELGSLLAAEQDREVAASQASVQSRSGQAVLILVIVIVGTLAIGATVAYVLPKRLVANLDRLVEAARAIGRGDLDQDVEIRSGDEVEELAVRFREMQAGVKRLQQLALQDRELEIAATIQQNLLQRSMPESPSLRILPLQRQANLVGGDWYDVDISGTVATVVVGDASGKGIAAALMATVVLSVLRAERRLGSVAHRVVTHANEALREATDSDAFSTLTYATIDTTTGHATWLNMGHPAPFLLRGRDNVDRAPIGDYLEGPRNRALGWFEDPGLLETHFPMQPGDRIVFYTDGFLEAKAKDGEVFGEHRFAEALVRLAGLPAEGILAEAAREVESFAAGKLDDDLTMLIVEFMGAPSRVAEGEAPSDRIRGEEPWHSKR